MDLLTCSPSPLVQDDCLESWKQINSGGFGVIYRAQHKKWQMDVAIKLLHYNDGSDTDLLREADLMRRGENPNVLKIRGVYKGRPLGDRSTIQMGLVMEYMERGSLADLQLALNRPPPWPLTFRIIYQIALGMNFLHQLSPPLLHLDLKPSNVLLDDSLNAKLTDFGLAKIAKSSSKRIDEDDDGAAGTTSYMPPEAFHPSKYVPAFSSDVYSYGILLWSVVTGKQPYPILPNYSSLVRFRVREGDRPDLTALDSSQADGLGDLIDLMKRCWDSDPESRPIFMECIGITKNVYELYKQHVPDAVCAILKHLDNKVKNSSSSSLPYTCTNPQTNSGTKQHNDPTVKRPMQEMGPLPKANGAGNQEPGYRLQTTNAHCGSFAHSNSPALPGLHCKPAARAPPPNTQRQYSAPGEVTINLSNVTGVQIGNNNFMNVQRVRQRQRHPTAPSGTSSKPRENPPSTKP